MSSQTHTINYKLGGITYQRDVSIKLNKNQCRLTQAQWKEIAGHITTQLKASKTVRNDFKSRRVNNLTWKAKIDSHRMEALSKGLTYQERKITDKTLKQSSKKMLTDVYQTITGFDEDGYGSGDESSDGEKPVYRKTRKKGSSSRRGRSRRSKAKQRRKRATNFSPVATAQGGSPAFGLTFSRLAPVLTPAARPNSSEELFYESPAAGIRSSEEFPDHSDSSSSSPSTSPRLSPRQSHYMSTTPLSGPHEKPENETSSNDSSSSEEYYESSEDELTSVLSTKPKTSTRPYLGRNDSDSDNLESSVPSRSNNAFLASLLSPKPFSASATSLMSRTSDHPLPPVQDDSDPILGSPPDAFGATLVEERSGHPPTEGETIFRADISFTAPVQPDPGYEWLVSTETDPLQTDGNAAGSGSDEEEI